MCSRLSIIIPQLNVNNIIKIPKIYTEYVLNDMQYTKYIPTLYITLNGELKVFILHAF